MSEEFSQEEKAYLDRYKALPDNEKVIVDACIRHIAAGSSWGFDTDLGGDSSAAHKIFKDLKSKAGYKFYRLSNGAVIDCISLTSAMRTVEKLSGRGAMNIQVAEKYRRTAVASLETFLKSGKDGIVGFYNTNELGTMTINGETYPSFKVDLATFADALGGYGYSATPVGVDNTLSGRIYTGSEISNDIRAQLEFMSGCSKSPSSNAVRCSVRPGSVK